MEDHSIFKVCCMKRVCRGCEVAACKKGMFDCAFCRTPRHENDESAVAMTQKRVDAKDPEALHFLGDQYYSGRCGLQENAARAINLWKEAVELGSIDAHFNLGHVYLKGKGVAPDEAMAIQHWESAAMKGHVEARSNLGAIEYNKGNDERAVRHHLIAAKLGDKNLSR
ncbi:hypothetical protein THAOC_37645 [Thalassiosira oceanica]|uniref:Uncharacterized protein n=1 Tax=Thalassiosira oceanica TaxID=159749 RepID=K0QY87_THAOC|nr:hypothetical protein THAOC_37645 [Thalassiosira oceanica]|eukprot:EJK43868.1 hypothetical protein THAOC_37645 [Thalassiosira oceanica]